MKLTDYLGTVTALTRREVTKFLRDRARILGTIGQVVGIWVVLGFGFQDSFNLSAPDGSGVTYTDYLFPGMILLVVLFSSIFATISVVEDRQTGFLHAALIAPRPRSVLLIGIISGGALLSLVQGGLMLLALPLTGHHPAFSDILLAILLISLISLAFTALGAMFAFRVKTTRGFHAVMNVLLMPLWVLSGALFPASGAHPVVRFLIRINPVSYALEALQYAINQTGSNPAGFISGPVAVGITVMLAIGMTLLAVATMPRSLRTD